MLAAAEAGADMVGVNFVPGVRRRVEPAFARKMVAQFRASSSRCVLVVGLFADQPADEVVRIAEEVGVDWVQLCGREGPDVWRRVGLPFLKSVHVPDLPDDASSRHEALLRLDERLQEVTDAGDWGCWTAHRPGSPEAWGRLSTGALPASWPGEATAFSWPGD